MRQMDAKQFIKEGANDVKIIWEGKGSALYQIVAKYYLPWSQVRPPAQEALSINVDYDRTTLSTDDIDHRDGAGGEQHAAHGGDDRDRSRDCTGL